MEWQPIETAPKDVGAILLWADGEIWLGEWNELDLEFDEEGDEPFWNMTALTDGGGKCGVWCETWSEDTPPTHWMPLPKPPEPRA